MITLQLPTNAKIFNLVDFLDVCRMLYDKGLVYSCDSKKQIIHLDRLLYQLPLK